MSDADDRSTTDEHMVLGALLHDVAALDRVGPLDRRHFTKRRHSNIFAALQEIAGAGECTDLPLIVDKMVAADPLMDQVETLRYLEALKVCVPSASYAAVYAKNVCDAATRRDLAAAAEEALDAAWSALDIGAAVESARDKFARIGVALPSREPPQSRRLDFSSLSSSQPPPRRWFRRGWLGPDPTLLAGAGGAGKSGVMQHEATAGSFGRSYITHDSPPYKSCIWNCEDEHDDIWRRQHLICEHEGLDMAELDGRLLIESRYGCENALMAKVQGTLSSTRLLEQLRQQVNDEAIDVLWLDNVAHFLHADHDDRIDVTAFINTIKGLVQGRPFGVVLLAHISRAQGSEFTGSVAWENAARMRWYLGPRLPDQRPLDADEEGDANVRFLAKRKSNYSGRDYVRFTMRDGLLVPDEAQQTHIGGLVSALDDRRAEEVCLAGFHSLLAMGVRTTDGKTTSDYLPTQILAKGLAGGFSKADLGRAMNRLMGREFIRGVIGKHANRSDKFGLVLKGDAR